MVIDEVTMELVLTLVKLNIVKNKPEYIVLSSPNNATIFYSELTDYWYEDNSRKFGVHDGDK